MSEHWRPTPFVHARPLGEAGFVAWADRWAAPAAPMLADAPDVEEDEIVPVAHTVTMLDAAAIEAAAHARGLAEGERRAEAMIAAERTELARLAAALETLKPEPSAALAALLGETVERLVRQIVGEVAIDRDRLESRARELAALITDATRPARLRLAPADNARLAGAELPVELIADPALSPGSLMLETEDGWIEDGPAIALDRLRASLERMGVAR